MTSTDQVSVKLLEQVMHLIPGVWPTAINEAPCLLGLIAPMSSRELTVLCQEEERDWPKRNQDEPWVTNKFLVSTKTVKQIKNQKNRRKGTCLFLP